MEITASAPGKCILFGEHFVVYGARGIACGIEPANEIRLHSENGAGFEYGTTIGTLKIGADGKAECPPALLPAAKVHSTALKFWPEIGKRKISAKVARCWPIKGVGNSASLSAALACGLAASCGKAAGANEIFECAQEADKVAHGGSPSGIDASAVTYGGAVTVKKIFSENVSYEFARIPIGKMEGWEFAIIDTLQKGREKANTADQIAKFARANGISKKPHEMSERERGKLCSEYDAIGEDAEKALATGDALKIGELMNENQKLLVKGNASCHAIDEAVEIALGAGAVGAKLTGAGGEGGAVLALFEEEKGEKVKAALKGKGFASFKFVISEKGAAAKKTG